MNDLQAADQLVRSAAIQAMVEKVATSFYDVLTAPGRAIGYAMAGGHGPAPVGYDVLTLPSQSGGLQRAMKIAPEAGGNILKALKAPSRVLTGKTLPFTQTQKDTARSVYSTGRRAGRMKALDIVEATRSKGTGPTRTIPLARTGHEQYMGSARTYLEYVAGEPRTTSRLKGTAKAPSIPKATAQAAASSQAEVQRLRQQSAPLRSPAEVQRQKYLESVARTEGIARRQAGRASARSAAAKAESKSRTYAASGKGMTTPRAKSERRTEEALQRARKEIARRKLVEKHESTMEKIRAGEREYDRIQSRRGR